MTTIEERVEAVILAMTPTPWSRHEAVQAIFQLITDEKIAENQMYLDRINNYKPDPNAISFGSASGAMEVQGFKGAFEDRIKQLKDQRRSDG